MKGTRKNPTLLKIAYSGIMAALCYVGYAFFPAISASGTKVHIGNAFVVLGSLLLGVPYGGLAGAVGLTLADILGGYAASAPRTFICKLLIGLIVGFIAHNVAKLNMQQSKQHIVKWTIISTLAGLLFNCLFEPALKWVWYTVLTPDAAKAEKAIKSLMALTVYTTYINAFINSIIAILLYISLRPALIKAGVIELVTPEENAPKAE